jgi:hypothetical protein
MYASQPHHAKAFARGGTVVGHQAADLRRERRHQCLRVAERGEGYHLADRLAYQVGQHDEGLGGPDIGRHDRAPAGVDVQEGGLAPANRLARGPFEHEFPGNQVVDKEGDRRAAHAHRAGEVGARDRLMRPDQVQDDLAVDLAASPALGHAEPRRVDTTHRQSSERAAGLTTAH